MSESIKPLHTKQMFVPGDNWLYLKIYTGYKVSDFILLDKLVPFAEKLINKKVIFFWFFIRYNDPSYHLRIRFKLVKHDDTGIIIKLIKDMLYNDLENKIIWKLQYDTYARELDRYGHEAIEFSENLFYYNSISVLKIINFCGQDNDKKCLNAFKLIDSILVDFKIELENKLRIMEELHLSFFKEFRIEGNFRHQFGTKYRKYKTDIEISINKNEHDFTSEYYYFKEKLVAKIYLIYNQSKQQSIDELIKSHIHMCMNRLFNSNQRLYELVIYDMLYRYYNSCFHKNKKELV